MGSRTGEFASLTALRSSFAIVIPICLLIVTGGIGFLTWDDIAKHRFHFKKYRMQSKVILTATALLVLVPAVIFFFNDFSGHELKERFCVSLFQAVTPRTAGFNTADMNSLTSVGRAMTVVLMLIGGSPGSTAGGIKTTTVAVLVLSVFAAFRAEKKASAFGRSIPQKTVIKSLAVFLTNAGCSFLAAVIICAKARTSSTCGSIRASAISQSWTFLRARI